MGKPERTPKKPTLVLVESVRKHDRNKYAGVKYGIHPDDVDAYVDGTGRIPPRVRLCVEILDNPKVNPEAQKIMREVLDRRSGRRSRVDAGLATAPKSDRAGDDPRLAILNALDFNKGESSLVASYKAVCTELDADATETRKEPMIEYLLANFDVYEALKA